MIKIICRFIFLPLLICSLNSCANKNFGEKPNRMKMELVNFEQLKGWKKDQQHKLMDGFIKSCAKLAKRSDKDEIGGAITGLKVGDFRNVCELAQVIEGMDSQHARIFFENWFEPIHIKDRKGNKEARLTGYHEPILYGSRKKSEKYQYPIYKKPRTLKPKSVFYAREDIESGALKGRKLELLYVDDDVERFFLHIQGSGKVILDDNTIVKLSYSATNNQPYVSIGKILLERKKIKKRNMSALSIKYWLRNNPEEAKEIMNLNHAYIFFKTSNENDVIGAQNVPLTPERSIAIDDDYLPYGLPIWIETRLPKVAGNKKYRRLMITQDTGSAIKGPNRGDIFFGSGPRATELAATMDQKAEFYALIPKVAARRLFKVKE